MNALVLVLLLVDISLPSVVCAVSDTGRAVVSALFTGVTVFDPRGRCLVGCRCNLHRQ